MQVLMKTLRKYLKNINLFKGTLFNPIGDRQSFYEIVYKSRGNRRLYVYDSFTAYLDVFSEMKRKDIELKIIED